MVQGHILRFLSGDEVGSDPVVLEDNNIFMKITKNARQQFWELLKRRWACITDTDILTMSSNELPIYDQFTFELFF